MPSEAGFIKLPRSILGWGQYRNPTVKILFIHLLLIATYKDNGLVKRGQLSTSLRNLANETGLTIQNVRTALKYLEAEHLVTQESTSSGTIISICKYDRYQGNCCDNQHNSQHSGQHTGQEKVSPIPPLKEKEKEFFEEAEDAQVLKNNAENVTSINIVPQNRYGSNRNYHTTSNSKREANEYALHALLNHRPR